MGHESVRREKHAEIGDIADSISIASPSYSKWYWKEQDAYEKLVRSQERLMKYMKSHEREYESRKKPHAGSDVIIERPAFIKEHSKLIGILERGKTKELKKEAKGQKKELEQVMKK
jgi:hypothetical protein